MARLRNRIVKADYWSDGDLLRMPRDKRDTYRGLWAVAEDSGCLENDPFTWKLLLWPGPLDADITVERVEQWRDELVDEGKLIAYQSGRRSMFFIEPFHRHEHPRNPQLNDLPLPPWVSWVPSTSDHRKGKYEVDWSALAAYQEDKSASYDDSTTVVQALSPARPALPSPALPSPALNPPGEADASAPEDTAQTIVAFAVDRARETGVALTKAVTGQLASEVGRQFKAGANPMLIRKAVAVLVDENKSPSTLSYVMRDLKGGDSRGRLAAVSGRSADGEW